MKYTTEFNAILNRTVYFTPIADGVLLKELQVKSDPPLDTTPLVNTNSYVNDKDSDYKLCRVLNPEMKREKYHSRKNEIISTLHWGQRKLLLTEIEFLTNYLYVTERNSFDCKKDTYVIYAGSAPGVHIGYLSKLFPRVYFILYDPRQFNIKLKECPRVITYEQFFTDTTAKEWESARHPSKNVLFISDIRTGSKDMKIGDFEDCVKSDNKNQLCWYNIIKPKMTMFKFRLPYDSDEFTEYLDGQVYLQPYAPETSTETRLIVGSNAKLIKYDNRLYEEQMFYFNKHTRNQTCNNLLNNIHKKNGVSDNFDGSSEIHILQQYLLNNSDELKSTELISCIIKMIGEISSELSSNRTLYSDQPLNDTKKNILTKLKSKDLIPKNLRFTQKTFNQYVIPNYGRFQKLGFL